MPTSARRPAVITLFVLLVAALVARTIFLAWEPPYDGTLHLDQIAPLGDAYWAMNLYVGGPAFAVSWIATAIFIVLLARGRTAPITLAAGVLVGLAGILFSLVITAEVLPFVFALETSSAPELFDAFNPLIESLLLPAILGGQLGVAVGVLVFLVVALITRAVPRWFAIAGLAYLVVFAAVPIDALGRAAVIASDLVQVALVVGIGWFGMRAALTPER